LDYPKRLIEVDLPIKRISAHARREKSIRHGHISTLHIWWARRPLAACRAVICAALWPDPADEKCPPAFRDEARRLMTEWAKNHLDLTSPESMSRFNRVKNDPKVLTDNVELRKTLLDFIADFANWDNSTSSSYLDSARLLTSSAHESLGGGRGKKPLVVDPFAGGGSIPLEALRIGAEAFATDLNPVALLLNRVVLEYVPKHGHHLVNRVRQWGKSVKQLAEKQLGEFYASGTDGETPIAFLWARTVLSEAPGEDDVVEVPVLRSMWLSKGQHKKALRWRKDTRGRIETLTVKASYADGKTRRVRRPLLEIFEPARDSDVGPGTVARGAVTCPISGYTTPVASVRVQLKERKGGTRDARLYAVVLANSAGGKSYRLANEDDVATADKCAARLRQYEQTNEGARSIVPDEIISLNEIRRISLPIYGMTTWGDAFTARQSLLLATLARLVNTLPIDGPRDEVQAVRAVLALAVDRQADFQSSLVTWTAGGEFLGHTFTRQALGMVWDFAEGNPWVDTSGNWDGAIEWICRVLEHCASSINTPGDVQQATATSHPLPDDAAAAVITDPPYYDAVPYSHLSDYFYVWLRRSLADSGLELFAADAVPKVEEIVVDRRHSLSSSTKGIEFYETNLQRAFADARRVVEPSGIGTIVFASKSTASWEAILKAAVDAGWTITASWPIDTEREARIAAQGQARLGSSVHLVCRPREHVDGTVREDAVGDWREILATLPTRIHEWMPRLAEEGVVGADAIFACLGPALEIFSRYSRVEKASGEVVTLREYLEQVWAAVSTEALSMIFRDADAAGLESDARFTAIVLWTLGAGGSSSSDSSESESEDAEEEDDDDESPKGKVAKGGYTLEYDAARKIAQGLGVNLEQIDSVVEVKGDKARLRPVSERAAALFGKAEKAEAATKKRGKKATQKKLFDKNAEEGGGTADTVTIGEGVATSPGVTALDRVHQAMLLFASGRADALKRFIVEDGVGGDARFWKLAQSLSALYPAGSDEKRWVDGVLARKKSFGF
jgi:adenine-specific DNA methylase